MVDKVKSHWNERWEVVVPTSPTKKVDYHVSDYGRIKSVEKTSGNEKLLKGSTSPRGYKVLNMRLAGKKRYSFYIHKFVAEHFVDKKDEAQEFVTHINGDRANNHWQNLQWMTRAELGAWQAEKGIYKNRERPSNAKMTESKVRLLKKRLKTGKTKKKILARNFGISTTQVKRIERGENWKHVQ